jgi:predicted dehydrogenase
MIEGNEMSGASPRVLRFGMVGGGQGSFIGDVHRHAATFDHTATLVAGSFSRNAANNGATGAGLGIEKDRVYATYQEMAEKESKRKDGIDFVSIVTPNASHFDIARVFLEHGINVACDKPLTTSLEDAEKLAALADAKGLLFAVTYVYTGNAMVKQAREMIRRGDIGDIRVVMGEYPQDWLATAIEKEGSRQAGWRTDPAQTGISNCVGDIGSHIENTLSYVTGLEIKELCANLDIFVKGRTLDDNAAIMLRFANGATGVYWCSQVAIGHENGLSFRVFGSKGSIEWVQENPNYLRVAMMGKPVETYGRGNGYLYDVAAKTGRIPSGHPEGYYEAFSNLYRNFEVALLKKKAGEKLTDADLDFPSVRAGVHGVRFITRCVESSKKGAVWTKF